MKGSGNISVHRKWWVNKLILVVIILFAGMSVTTMAQKQAYFWYFGKNAGLDFTGFDPMPLSNSQMDAPAGVASVSDSTGQLLFYTDGRNIWNSLHQKVNTGDLSGDPSSTQAATIVPDPDTADQFFLFTTRPFNASSPTNFGGNFYKIRIKPGEAGTILYDYSAATGKEGLWTGLTEKFCAVPFTRADGKTGYWFIMHEFNSSNFVIIKYDGVLGEPDFPVIGSMHQNDTIDDGTNRGAAGQMKVNDQGNRLALACEGGKFFELFRFNPVTGKLSNPMKIPAGDLGDKFAYRLGAYGVEFSPTGRFGYELVPPTGNYLYGSTRSGGQVYQWDLSLDYDRNQFVKGGQVKYSNAEIECGALQMAPNGKIYVAFKDQDFMGVINSPMRPDCKFEESGVRLINNDNGLGGLSTLGLPSTIPMLKPAEPFYFENLCLGDETVFYITNTDINSITNNTPRAWTFTKIPGSTVTKTSQTNEYRYRFTTPGRYRVRLTVFKSGAPVTYSRELTINPLPEVKLADKDLVNLCRGSSLSLDAGSGAFYEWEDVKIKVRDRVITTDSVYPIMEYRVKVTDYHGCVGWDTLWVEKKIPPVIIKDSTVRAFCGNKDGKAIVFPNGNILNYDYHWEGYPEVNSNTLSGINGGDYIVHAVSKSTLCEVTDTIKVDELGGSSVKIINDQGPVVCPGKPFTLTVEGAAEFEWISPTGLSGDKVTMSLDTTTIITVNAISRDAGRECTTVVTDTIRVYPKNIPDLGADRTSCAGWTVEVDGGEEYTAWNWSDGQEGRIARITRDMNPLILNATDRNGCVFSDDVRVNFMPSPKVNLGRDTAVCSKDPVRLEGGTGESYLWSTGETTPFILAGATGDYILSITKDGCSLEDTIHVQLNDPDLLKIDSVSFRDITCYGAANGAISIYAQGDGRDFYYSIDNGITWLDNGGIFKNLVPGSNHIIKVLEDSACTAVHSFPVTLTQPDSLMLKFCSLAPSCPECTDGEISVVVTGGTRPYKILLNGSVQDTLIRNLGFGRFVLSITDSLDCSVSSEVILAEGTRPAIISGAAGPVCSGVAVNLQVINPGQVEWINPPGKTGSEIVVNPLETTKYMARSTVTDADNFTCETILEYTVEVIPFTKPRLGEDILACTGDSVPLDGGDYLSWLWSNGLDTRFIHLKKTFDPLILTVTDINGCLLKDTIAVVFSPPPVVNLGDDQSLCTSDPVVLSGGTGANYLWSTGEVTPEISVTATGKYSLLITTGGCSSSDTVNVKVLNPDFLKIDSVRAIDNTCFGGSEGSLEIFTQGSGSSWQYSIDDGITYQADPFFGNLPADSYSIRISEDSLCFKDYTAPVVIGQPDSIHVSYRLKSPKCETCSDGQLRLEISGGLPPYQITLGGAPIELVTSTLSIGTYVIVITDANRCTRTVEFTLELLNLVPNVITTNGDGVNDLWAIPMLKYYSEAVVRVFNTAGRLVYESVPGYPVPWDGRNEGNPLPMGTYYYIINLGEGEQQLTGSLTILR